ncbi:DNA mismatch repair protein MutS [Candidatus Peregrinibacteria bacterium]|nr:DNA mismatch repair protein MutS [Candidatus Peregrinibacteria bacterium]
MMKQYLELKEKYRDCLLFFRLGDFYELFFEDAIETSKLLGLTLTGRGKDENRVPMCGVPYHAAEQYIAKLTKLGKKVAICEQLSDPNEPGIVKRDVVRIVTPGTTLDEKVLDEKSNNYAMAITNENGFQIAFADILTGEFFAENFSDFSTVLAEIQRINPSEIIYDPELFAEGFVNLIADNFPHIYLFTLKTEEKTAINLLSSYLKETQKNENIAHLSECKNLNMNKIMHLDEATLKNLELTETLREGKKEGSLLWVLDKTKTSMGGRLMRYFITHPLTDKSIIVARHDAVQDLIVQEESFDRLKDELEGIMDLERLLGKLSLGKGNARDLVGLKNSLFKVPQIKILLNTLQSVLIKKIHAELDPCQTLVDLIDHAIVEDPPLSLTDGNIVADGYNNELDELKKIAREGKTFIQNLQNEESKLTGIHNLKIRYNKVFGYYIEISKGQLDKVPNTYIRKQTLVNAERFITPELKEFEEKVLHAEEKIIALEQKIFNELRSFVLENIELIKTNAKAIALLDVLMSFTHVAKSNGYVKPEITEGNNIIIYEGRHPVIEKVSNAENFVPNDTFLIQNEERIKLITGPNMGGKSTYLRQVALIVLMAQIGSLVPAKTAELGIADRIFTRVGASDNLVKGQSTFMVEMEEASNILKNATENSLIILDEIGRGTSTYDGMSIAWSILEYIHDDILAKSLFATHYHELIPLADKLSNAENYSVAVTENDKGVIFLYKLLKGGIDKSYGIEVAKLAGLPGKTIERAKQILHDLEVGTLEKGIQKELSQRVSEEQVNIFERQHNPIEAEAVAKLKAMDLNNLTPLQALNKLEEIKLNLNE